MSVLEKYLEKPVVVEASPEPELELVPKPKRSAGAKLARVVVTLVVLAAVAFGGLMGWAAIFNPPMDVEGYESGTTSVMFTSAHGGYTAAFPAQPKLSVTSERVGDGSIVETDATVDRRNGTVGVSYIDLSSGLELNAPVAEVLNVVVRGSVREGGARLISLRPVTAFGRRAVHFKASKGEQVNEGEAFVVGKRMYILEAGGFGSHPKMFERLKRSFRLNKPAA